MSKFDLSTTSGLTKAIDSVVRRAGSWQKDVQIVSVAVLGHVRQHGDWTLAVRLVDGVSKCDGVKKSTLRNYMECFMRGEFYTEDGETKFRYDDGASASTVLVEQAEAVQWYAFKPEKTPEAFDLNAKLAKLLKDLGNAKEISVDLAEVREQLTALTAAVDAIEGEAVTAELSEELADVA